RSDADVPCVTCNATGIDPNGFKGDIGVDPGIASGPGYRFVAADGGIFAFGQPFAGSAGATKLPRPPVGIAATAPNNGYWLVACGASSVAAVDPNEFKGAIVGVAGIASGRGYRFVAADGGIFSFGDGKFLGSMGATRLNKPIVGMAKARDGDGYWLVASDGGIFSFGAAGFHGSTGNIKLASPIVGMAS